MKANPLTRRGAIGLAALLSSTAAIGVPGMNLSTFLKSTVGQDKVKSILKKYFEAAVIGEETIARFYKSLLVAEGHTQDSQFFVEHMSRQELEERLDKYVIEEFFVTTNYVSFLAGEASEVVLLKS